jgi:hypothetical protein
MTRDDVTQRSLLLSVCAAHSRDAGGGHGQLQQCVNTTNWAHVHWGNLAGGPGQIRHRIVPFNF